MTERPLLSLCMIAKNEQHWLPMSLGSCKPWVDEIILVDTGSTDSTIQIAEQHGAKVFHHPWQGDFSLHRNQSLEYATGHWLLVLDADEELDQQAMPQLRSFLEAASEDCLLVRIKHLASDGSASWQLTPRLIRADSGLRFAGRIHEDVQGGGHTRTAPLNLIHHGFALDSAVTAGKARRNLEIIRRWIEDEPDNFSARAYLAQSLMAGAGTPRQTEQAARSAIEVGKRYAVELPRLSRAYHPLLMALTAQRRLDDLIAAANQCLAMLPQYPDPLYSLSWAFFEMGRWSSVCRHCRRFVELQDHWQVNYLKYPYPHNLSAGLFAEVFARWTLAAAHLRREDEAAYAFERLLEDKRAEQSAHHVLTVILDADPLGFGARLAAMAAGAHPEWLWLKLAN